MGEDYNEFGTFGAFSSRKDAAVPKISKPQTQSKAIGSLLTWDQNDEQRDSNQFNRKPKSSRWHPSNEMEDDEANLIAFPSRQNNAPPEDDTDILFPSQVKNK